MRQLLILVVLMILLAGCGGQQATNTVTSAAAPVPTNTAAGLEHTVRQAIDAMAQKDKTALVALFDGSVGNYAPAFADSAIDDWSSKQGEVKPLATMALGPIQSQAMKTPETNGETTRIIVAVTYQIGKADGTFNLRQRDQGWKLLEIKAKTTERKPS